MSAEALGFTGCEASGWENTDAGQPVVYRSLHSLDDLVSLESLQKDVFGVTDRDVIPASELVVVPETGGAVIAAYVGGGAKPDLAGALFGWGGFVGGEPLVVSDFLAIREAFRGIGLGADLKRLQALLACERGFRRIVWTVDPLRAANARLNVTKLGATADRYERNRYGEAFGAGLYGGLPTDRLHMVWDLTSERVRRRLARCDRPRHRLDGVPAFSPGLRAPFAHVEIPTDIDELLRTDVAEARRWRFHVRHALEAAFAEGWEVSGFASDHLWAAYILSPRGIASGGGQS